MRLINTATLELEEFPGLVPKYAILSHTWGDDEITLQDWKLKTPLALYSNLLPAAGPKADKASQGDDLDRAAPFQRDFSHRRVGSDLSIINWLSGLGLEDTKFAYWKILKACLRARSDDLHYLWVDTNCIDKTSSAELSEAINSMYAWYRNASVCYAYLMDVPSDMEEKCDASNSRFRRSRWFKRGWTLQELLAPKNVVFFSRDWTEIGRKDTMTKLLEEITGIRANYLLQLEGIDGASIAQRMSWVSNRSTSRPEDIAYCMLGIFDVNMPLIYGEGSKAFVRLQEEIIKISDDHSIFAWTWIPELSDPLMRGNRRDQAWNTEMFRQSAVSTQRHRKSNFPEFRLSSLRENTLWKDPQRSTMLAPDPITFFDSGTIRTLSPSSTVAPFTMTNAGLSITLPVIQHITGELYFAVLHCTEDRRNNTQTLICVPLVQHFRQANRFTRTWFPLSPFTIVRPGLGMVSPRSQTIQVCRDVQHVAFYYPAFGGTSHSFGFWLLSPKGVPRYQLAGGFTVGDGVFNGYGIFINPDAASSVNTGDSACIIPRSSEDDAEARLSQSNIRGGLLVFEPVTTNNDKTIDSNMVIVIFLAVSLKRTGVTPHDVEVVARHCDVSVRASNLCSTRARLARSYSSLCAKYSAVVRSTVVSSTEKCVVRLLNECPLSHGVGARIWATEVDFV
jgi:hypothetical protein